MARGRLLSRLRAMAWDQRGSVLPIAAAGVVMTAVAAALAVDIGRAYAFQAKLRTTADAAALAAATRLPDQAAALQAAQAYAAKNMAPEEFGEVLDIADVEFGDWDTQSQSLVASPGVVTAVRVTTRLSSAGGNPLTTVLAGLIGHDTLEVAASATAGRRSPTCILALEPSASKTLLIGFTANVQADNCTVQVNSTRSAALSVESKAVLTAGAICVAGDSAVGTHASASPDPTDGCPPSPDPLAGLERPAYGGCDHTDAEYNSAIQTLHPGVYCGGLRIDGDSDITLAAGTYVIKDGPFLVSGKAIVAGSAVTIFLTGTDGQIFFDRDSQVSLIAPADGPLAGITVFQDPAFGGEHTWDSKRPLEMQGTIYLPAGHLSSESTSAITPLHSCNVFIVRTLSFVSKSGVSIDLDGSDCRNYLPKALRGTVVLLE